MSTSIPIGTRTVLVVAVGLASIIACGKSPASGAFEDSVTSAGGGGDGGNRPGDPGVDGDGGVLNNNGPNPGKDPGGLVDAACATASATSGPAPVNIVIMFDNSDSMQGGSKFASCSTGLKAFFADPKSKGLSASIQYFCGSSCDVAGYKTPAVPLTSLPEATVFAASIDAQKFCLGTPTNPALKGAIGYAGDLKTSAPNVTTVVALVTDGLPSAKCGKIDEVDYTAMAGLAAGIKTYVIGVGGATTNLNEIAGAGGTGKALIVQTNNAAQIGQDFEKALDLIRGQTVSCDFALPPPPAGKELDVNAVNVLLTNAQGASSPISYSKDCAAGTGWHYDDVGHPTRVQLCTSSCDAAKASASGKVEVVFGCATQGDVVK